VPPVIYFGGVTLEREAREEAVLDAPGSICDSWQTLDLAPAGLRVWRREPWLVRPAGPLTGGSEPEELELVQVSTAAEVEELEAVSVRGFGNEDATIEPGTWHPPTILDEPRMVLWLARVDGKPVGAAMSYRTDNAVGLFGVTTIASARRRGYGGALTRAAALPETGLPSVLASSSEGRSLYESLGFQAVGQLAIWARPHGVT
jgi:ribosomal protein S18 acetylase RimI-like enzyme